MPGNIEHIHTLYTIIGHAMYIILYPASLV